MPIANPYLKKKTKKDMVHTSSSTTTRITKSVTTPKFSSVSKPFKQGYRQETSKSMVTPSPKTSKNTKINLMNRHSVQKVHRKVGTTITKSKHSSAVVSPSKTTKSTKSRLEGSATITTRHNKNVLPPMKKTPKSLKAKLKWDIAQLKRQKLIEKQKKIQLQQQQQRKKEEAIAKQKAEQLRLQREKEELVEKQKRKLQQQEEQEKKKQAAAAAAIAAASQRAKEIQQQQQQRLRQEEQRRMKQETERHLQQQQQQQQQQQIFQNLPQVGFQKSIPSPLPITTNNNKLCNKSTTDPFTTTAATMANNCNEQSATVVSTNRSIVHIGLSSPPSTLKMNKESSFHNCHHPDQNNSKERNEIRGILEEMLLIVTARTEAPQSTIGDPQKKTLASQRLRPTQQHSNITACGKAQSYYYPQKYQPQQHHQLFYTGNENAKINPPFFVGQPYHQQKIPYPIPQPHQQQPHHPNWIMSPYNSNANGRGPNVYDNPLTSYSGTTLPNSAFRPPPSLVPTPGKRKKYCKKNILKPLVLHKEPMVPPSPYAISHEIVQEPILILKQQDKSFGVNIRYETKSALVDPPPPPPSKLPVPSPLPSSIVLSPPPPPPLSSTSPSSGNNHTNENQQEQQQEQKQQQLTKQLPSGVIGNDPSLSMSTMTTPLLPPSNNDNGKIDSHKGDNTVSPAVNKINIEIKNESKPSVESVSGHATIPSMANPLSTSFNVADVPLVVPSSSNMNPTQPPKEIQVKATITTTTTILPTAKVATNSVTSEASPVAHQRQLLAPPPRRRTRRKRVFFGAMTVLDAIKQAQICQDVDGNLEITKNQLQPGDVILSINGKSTLGLTFQQACGLFSTGNTPFEIKLPSSTPASPTTTAIKQEEKIQTNVPESSRNEKNIDVSSKPNIKYVSCSLIVARLKPKPVKVKVPSSIKLDSLSSNRPLSLPSNALSSSKAPAPLPLIRGDLSKAEIAELVWNMVKQLEHPNRPLGFTGPPNVLTEYFQKSPLLVRRDPSMLQNKWFQTTNAINVRADASAREAWKKQWKEESSGKAHYKAFTKYSYLTDARRSELRALPRPGTGCKCGSSNHDFVHDPNCVLYGNIRHLLQTTVGGINNKTLLNKKSLLKPFNAVEAAALKAELRKKSERESEVEEARFVDEMEKIQIKQFHKAIFAPSLTAMVLSAVVSLSEMDGKYGILAVNDDNVKVESSVKQESNVSLKHDISDDEDDDDNVPLVALAPATKKQKLDIKAAEPTLNVKFLADLLKYISDTWGHVFKEPSHSDHSWRWEIFRGQVGSNTLLDTEAFSKNPRRPGSHSYETIKFCLEDKKFAPNMGFTHQISTQLSAQNDTKIVPISGPTAPSKDRDDKAGKIPSDTAFAEVANGQIEDLALIAHLVSPEKSGLYDELVALIRSGLLKVDNKGVAVLNGDEWYTKLDVLLLNDMFHHWSPSVDIGNKFCMNERVRQILQANWERIDGDWALADDPFDIVHHEEEYQEWRRSFENTNQAQEDYIEGIGKFGF